MSGEKKDEEIIDEEITDDDSEGDEGDESDKGDDKDDAQEGEDELTASERKELEDLRKKEYNFKKMRSNVKQTKDEVKREKTVLKENWLEFKENLVNERKEDALSLLVGDDEETRKKVLYNFNRIDPGKDAVLKDEIFKRMREAVNMLGGNQQPNIVTRGGHSGYRGNSDGVESSESQNMRKDMKIDDETKKKYSGENWAPKI